jgi:hypothetical protein
MIDCERERLSLELSDWLRTILAGAPGSAARFVDDADAISISPRWDAPHALTLVVTARGRAETGRYIARRGAVLDPLEAPRLGERLGLLIRIHVRRPGERTRRPGATVAARRRQRPSSRQAWQASEAP